MEITKIDKTRIIIKDVRETQQVVMKEDLLKQIENISQQIAQLQDALVKSQELLKSFD